MIVRVPNRSKGRRGFLLLGVIVVLALISIGVVLVNEQVVESLQTAGMLKSSEMVRGGMEMGLDRAMESLIADDVVDLAETDYDIFSGPVPIGLGRDYVGPFPYPSAGASAGTLEVRVGLRPGQRTRAPAGEDVRRAYGQVVELQLSVQSQGTGPPAEERASVGVLLPRVYNH